jgi:dephospho-CoA kinase
MYVCVCVCVADVFRKNDIPVMDADQVVHDMYAQGGAAVEPVGAAFPGVVVDGAISRPELGTL